jgi:hypothetical protein
MLKFSNLLMNIIFLILLNITTLIKSNKDSNTNFISNSNLENKFLEERAKEEANLSKNINSKYGNDNNLYNMITDFKKNLFQENTLEDFFINNEFYIKNQTSYLDIKDIKKKFENIFLQTNKNVNYESFFNSTKYTWETISSNGDIPKETKGFSMVLSGTTLIIFGGRDLNDKYYNEMYFFDLQQKSWTKILAKGLIPTPRAFHSAIIRGTTMWIFGGSSDTGYLNDLYSFDLETVKN